MGTRTGTLMCWGVRNQMWNRLPRIPNPIHSRVSVEQSLKLCSSKNQKNLIKEGWMERDQNGWMVEQMDGRECWVVVLMD